MNTPIRIAVAAAAVIAIALVGVNLVPKSGGVGGLAPTPVPTVDPTATPSPSATPTSTPAALAVIPPGKLCSSSTCVTGALQAGTYSIDAGTLAPGDLTFTVPVGWTTEQGFVRKNFDLNPPGKIEDSPNELVFSTWFVTDIYTDACHWQTTEVSAGTTVDQLTSLLEVQKGRVGSNSTNTTIGGYPAKRIQLMVSTSIDMTACDHGVLKVWPDPGGGGLCCGAAGSTDVVDVINVAGQRFVVVARYAGEASPADVAELNALVASIKIAAPSPTPKPSGASPSP